MFVPQFKSQPKRKLREGEFKIDETSKGAEAEGSSREQFMNKKILRVAEKAAKGKGKGKGKGEGKGKSDGKGKGKGSKVCA